MLHLRCYTYAVTAPSCSYLMQPACLCICAMCHCHLVISSQLYTSFSSSLHLCLALRAKALWCRYHHVPGSIHIRKEHILLQHRPWHTLLNPSVADHGMSKYHMGIYRHMPGGLDAMPWLWRHRPSKMLQKAAKAKQRSVATTNVTPGMLTIHMHYLPRTCSQALNMALQATGR